MTPTQLGEAIFDFMSRLEQAEADEWDEMAYIEGRLHLLVPFFEGKWVVSVSRPDETDTVQ